MDVTDQKVGNYGSGGIAGDRLTAGGGLIDIDVDSLELSQDSSIKANGLPSSDHLLEMPIQGYLHRF